MKTITHELPRDLKEARLYLMGDVHLGDPLCDYKGAKKLIDRLQADPAGYIILNGDLINNALKDSVSDIYSETCNPKKQIDILYDLLSPVKDRILVMIPGNHEGRTYKATGIDVLETLARIMYGDAYRERYSAGAYLIFLNMGAYHGKPTQQVAYTIYGKHGSGGGKKMGGKVNAVVDMGNIVNADIYIHSHTHEPFATKKPRFEINKQRRIVTEKESLYVNTNAFLLYGGYGEEQGYSVPSRTPLYITLGGYEKEITCTL